MSEHLFWLSDDQFNRLEPLLPNKVRGVPRVDDRKVISGIVDEIQAQDLAEEILQNPPEIGYLTVSNALQWRLQYRRLLIWLVQ